MKRISALIATAIAVAVFTGCTPNQTDNFVTGSKQTDDLKQSSSIKVVINANTKSRAIISVKEHNIVRAEIWITGGTYCDSTVHRWDQKSGDTLTFTANGLGVYAIHINEYDENGKVFHNSRVFEVASMKNYTIGVTLGGNVEFDVTGIGKDTTIYDSIPWDTIPHDSIPWDTIPWDTIPFDTIPWDTIPHDSIPWDTTIIDSTWFDTLVYDSTSGLGFIHKKKKK